VIAFGSTDSERRYSLVYDMRRVLARVRWWQRSKRQRRVPIGGQLCPLQFMKRQAVRWMLKRHGGTADVILSNLRADVRQLLAAEAEHNGKIAKARRELVAEIADERLVALGRPGVGRRQIEARGSDAIGATTNRDWASFP
jgi:hypothetical protein